MGSYFPAIIRIGGTLKRKNVKALIDAFDTVNVGTDYGQGSDWKDEKDLRGAINDDGFLMVADDEASGGAFDEIEALCVKLGLSFDRHSDHYMDCGSCVRVFRAADKFDRTFAAGDGFLDILVSGEAVERAVRLIEAGESGSASRALRAELPVIPELPKFQIT